jgi:nitroimidazol reductase NimA-like FMN-containing flavoprotein (pyridoxamine 5'-phosphate oxidase superfamily)
MPSRRTQIEMTEEEVRAFLDEHMVMQCATIGPRGVPHMVPLWYVRYQTPHPAQAAEPPASGLELRGWTYAKSQKARNLERDPRATLGIEEGVEYQELRGVMFECDVVVERDTEAVAGYGMDLVDRYAGGAPEVKEAFRRQAPKRVGLRFVPTRTVSWDHRKLGGTY